MILLAAGALGGAVGLASGVDRPARSPDYLDAVSGCRVTDGDTLRCGGERIRLLAIDAPELPGHCRPGRACVPGDPYAASRGLERALQGELRIARLGRDAYGRTLAAVAGDQGDLSCWQIEHGHAVYRADWDDGRRIARTCPQAILK